MKAIITVSRMTASIIAVAAAGMVVSVGPLPPPTVIEGPVIAAAGIASTSQVGVPTSVASTVAISPLAIAGGSIVSTPAVSAASGSVQVLPASVASLSSLGLPGISLGAVAIVPSGIPSGGQLGSPSLVGNAPGASVIAPAGIVVASSVSSPVVNRGAVSVSPSGVDPSSFVSAPSLAAGARNLVPAGITSTSVVAGPSISLGAVAVTPAGIASTLALGAPSVANAGVIYDTDAAAVFAAMTVQPSSGRKTLYNNLIVGLKADGVWSKLDWLAILAAETAQAARLNLKNPAKSWSTVNSPVFTADRGYQGDGTSAHLDMGEPFGFSGALFVQNDAHLMAAANDGGSATSRSPHIGNTGSTRAQINILGVAGNNTYAINASVAVAYAGSGVANGIRMVTRSTGTDSIAYTNGAVVSSAASTSSAVSATNGTLLRASTTYSDDRVSAAGSGSNLTSTELTAYYNRLSTFLSAIGAL